MLKQSLRLHGRGENFKDNSREDQKQSTTKKRQKSWSHHKELETGPLQNPTMIFVDF
jgi:hypothetical protein